MALTAEVYVTIAYYICSIGIESLLMILNSLGESVLKCGSFSSTVIKPQDPVTPKAVEMKNRRRIWQTSVKRE